MKDLISLLLRGVARAFLAAVLVIALSPCAHAARDRVLFISSYSPTFPTFPDQVAGISSVLDKAGVDYDIEYMDSKRLPDKQNTENFKRMLAFKLSHVAPYQVVIAADDNAVRFVLDTPELFQDMPMVFFGLNNVVLGNEIQTVRPNTTGIMEDISARQTIAVARELFPASRTVALIYDDTSSGSADFKRVLPVTRLFPWLKFERYNLARITYSDLAAALRALPRESFVLLLSAYHDSEGNSKTFNEIVDLIAEASPGPAFHLWRHGIGQGLFGGRVVDHRTQGRLAAQSALAILSGIHPQAIPVVKGDGANQYIFDGMLIDRFEADKNGLPPESIIVNDKSPEELAPRNPLAVGVLALLLLGASVLVLILLQVRQSTARKFQDMQKRYQSYVDMSPDCMVIVDHHGRFLEVSRTMVELTGYSEEELLSMFMVDLLPQEGRADFMERFDSMKREGKYSGALALQKKNKDFMYVFADAMKMEEGLFIGFLRDVTDRRTAQLALEESEERFRALIDQAEDAMLVHDLTGHYVLVNRKACEQLGYPREVLLTKTVWDVDRKAPEDITKAVENVSPGKYETELVRSDGRSLPVEIQISRITYVGREVVLCLARDITERRKSEELLRREAMVNLAQAEIAKVLTSPEADIKTISETVCRHALAITGSRHGYVSSIDPVSGDNVVHTFTEMMETGECRVNREGGSVRFTSHRGSYNSLWGHALNQRVSFYTNEPYSHPASKGLPSGHVIIERFLSCPAVYEDTLMGQIALANPAADYKDEDQRNVTVLADLFAVAVQRRRIEDSLVSAKDAAEAASRAKGEFLANVSHEIRTPLNGIFGMLQLLQATETSREQADYITTAMTSGQNLLRVINDVLDFSKIEAGKIELQEEVFSLRELVESVHSIFVSQAGDKGISFTWQVDESAHDQLVGDAGRIRQILFNLVGNAMKFTSEGEIVISADTLPEGGDPEQANLFFSVADTGIGIPEEKLELIFQAFEQVDGSYSRKYPGTGLGLGIVRRFVELMDGKVRVKSSEGMGSTFSFTVKVGVDLSAEPVGKAENVQAPEMPALRILLAEDDRVNRITAQRMLEKLGHSVVWAQNGAEAWSLVREREFDCVFMDIQMPIMDGIEAVTHIRNSDDPAIAGIPVIALTAHAMKGDKEEFLDAGMNDYVSKPVSKKDLDEVLRRTLLKGGSFRTHA